MNATLENSQVEAPAKPKPWEPPKVDYGTQVLWWQAADPNTAPRVLIVQEQKPGSRTIRGYFLAQSGNVDIYVAAARHMSDPDIKPNGDNVSASHQGGWDFRPEDKRRWAFEERITGAMKEFRAVHLSFEERITALEEKAVDENPTAERKELTEQLKALGIQFNRAARLDELEALLDEATTAPTKPAAPETK